MPPAIRPYRDFVTPALHRRFASASGFTLLACYSVAVLMGPWNDALWAWFPLGSAAIKTGLLFIVTLIVYILRVSQMHVGQRSTTKPFETFRQYALRFDTPRTVVAYALSAFLFSEVYIWSRNSDARLQYTDPGKLHERIKLNERPLFLRSMFILLAFGQAAVHLWRDYDRVPIPVSCSRKLQNKSTSTPVTSSPGCQVLANLPKIVIKSGVMVGLVVLFGPVVYLFILRKSLWSWHYAFARYLVSLPKIMRPSGLGNAFELLLKFGFEGTLLVSLWDVSNNLFDQHMAREPLKKDKPITNDSKDPNGSLLNGLKSKKEVTKNIAFWELALITGRFAERRQAIYQEIDRKNGATGTQIVALCLKELRAIISRVDSHASSPQGNNVNATPVSLQLVPRISSPLKEDKITDSGFQPENRLQKFEAFASDVARVHSSPENAARAPARKFLESGAKNLNQQVQQSTGFINGYWNSFTQSSFGELFRTTVRRTANVVVNGAPYSHICLIINAVNALTSLTVQSLKEDALGQFHKEVPGIIRVFTVAIKKTEAYLQTLVTEEKVPEVMDVLDLLRTGLEKILTAFAEYLHEMEMTKDEIQEAKEVLLRREMQERRR
ncbi:hypothetical protein GQ43DRAFT_442796 [Delitschia confertaspora ATCC 74209]|uniref:Nucleoporin protein Ndc1-Nup n=1 Tax=Delitschia confertaspora ATCC 74209 TaxID=1513339 RepID=A0A9P4JIW1_9PLEO|nr:hypothetical protein GQ43DRAFT_442796 [Delitschia confertaspora ATCC 74209]